MRRLRAVSEAEVIAEFLRKEFYNPEYHRDRDSNEEIVLHPDLTDERECHLRRNLLYRRRRQLWRELPLDTTWWEVELEQDDLARLDIFPRGRLAGLSGGRLSLSAFAEHIRENRWKSKYCNEVTKIQSLRYEIAQYDSRSSAILIGMSDHDSLSIFEGNHRMIAAFLVSTEKVLQNFRYFCGFSPEMNRCVWYRNSMTNLWRYLQRRIRFEYLEPHKTPGREFASKQPIRMPARDPALKKEEAIIPAKDLASK